MTFSFPPAWTNTPASNRPWKVFHDNILLNRFGCPLQIQWQQTTHETVCDVCTTNAGGIYRKYLALPSHSPLQRWTSVNGCRERKAYFRVAYLLDSNHTTGNNQLPPPRPSPKTVSRRTQPKEVAQSLSNRRNCIYCERLERSQNQSAATGKKHWQQ